MRNRLRLNIVTNDTERVFQDLNRVFGKGGQGLQVTLANRVSQRIIEFDIQTDRWAVISLENIREAIPYVDDWDIRFCVG